MAEYKDYLMLINTKSVCSSDSLSLSLVYFERVTSIKVIMNYVNNNI